MTPKPDAPTLTAWIPVPSPCARCGKPTQVQCSKSFSRIVSILCTHCGWRFELDPIRAAAKTQQREPDDIDGEPPPGELTPP